MVLRSRKKVPIMNGLWEECAKGIQLAGSECNHCGEIFFPRKQLNFCNQCHEKELKDILFSGHGSIVAFTKVEREPAGGFYKGNVPYMYGIVQLDEGVNIYSQLVETPDLAIGRKVEMVIEKLYEEKEHDVLTFKYKTISCGRMKEDE